MSTELAPSPIDRLETVLVRNPPAQIEIVHHFAPGIYAREMRVRGPREIDGVVFTPVITGRRHKTRHLNVVSKGHIEVVNELDGSKKHFYAGDHFISEPGTRRAGIVHEDTTWTTIHANPDDADEIEEIENRLVEKHNNPLLAEPNSPCHLSP